MSLPALVFVTTKEKRQWIGGRLIAAGLNRGVATIEKYRESEDLKRMFRSA
jgi:hypothetical protein